MLSVFGSRLAASPGPLTRACTPAPSRVASSAPRSSSRRAASLAAVCATPRECARAAAAPSPTFRITFSVPARLPCSCPAPIINFSIGTSRRWMSAPQPLGAYILCPATVKKSTPSATKSTGTLPTLCDASVWHSAPAAWASPAASRTGMRAPTSLFECMTVTSAVSPGRIASSSASTAHTPSASTATSVSSNPSTSRRKRHTSSTAGCSTHVVTIWLRFLSAARIALAAPRIAQLLLSVPPEVNVTCACASCAFSSAASCRLALATASAVRRP
mmetsp:Transcript_15392/g.47862  ORF Transcript_15392/g.47862 Transcript_15392/m.47862 type:complete len:274 (-) Transcript_15392:239-1060(-)